VNLFSRFIENSIGFEVETNPTELPFNILILTEQLISENHRLHNIRYIVFLGIIVLSSKIVLTSLATATFSLKVHSTQN